jgi:hypothetical protein
MCVCCLLEISTPGQVKNSVRSCLQSERVCVRAGNTSSLSIPRHYGLINYSRLVKKNNQVRRLVIYLLNVYYEIWDIDGCAIARAQSAGRIIFYNAFGGSLCSN